MVLLYTAIHDHIPKQIQITCFSGKYNFNKSPFKVTKWSEQARMMLKLYISILPLVSKIKYYIPVHTT